MSRNINFWDRNFFLLRKKYLPRSSPGCGSTWRIHDFNYRVRDRVWPFGCCLTRLLVVLQLPLCHSTVVKCGAADHHRLLINPKNLFSPGGVTRHCLWVMSSSVKMNVFLLVLFFFNKRVHLTKEKLAIKLKPDCYLLYCCCTYIK